jgi:uncharacterized membrane protein YcaP (DUF421 family)
VEENMNRERVTPDEIMAEARRAGLERLDQIRWGILEEDGKISIVADETSARQQEDASLETG